MYEQRKIVVRYVVVTDGFTSGIRGWDYIRYWLLANFCLQW